MTTGASPKKKSSGPLLILIVIIFFPIILLAVGKYEPTKLAIIQEQILGILHGGVSRPSESSEVDPCVVVPYQQRTPIENGVIIQQRQTMKAVRRFERTVRFGDGAEMTIIYSAPPENNPECPQ
jgi:hypothetical protein